MRAALTRNWRLATLPLLAALTAGLIWRFREQPLVLGPLRLDGLGLFFVFACVAGLSLNMGRIAAPRRAGVLLALAALALTTRLTPLVALLYCLMAVVAAPPLARPHRAARGLRGLGALLAGLFQSLPLAFAAACLLLSYGMLAARGAVFYDERVAGAALDSLVFWFALLGAVLPLLPRPASPLRGHALDWLAAPLWLYPLARLYSIGPWNSGWGLAAVLLGTAVALWNAWGAVSALDGAARLPVSLAALALACFGLSSSAGIAAGCYALLVALASPHAPAERSPDAPRFAGQFLPLVAPFVAAWMVVGAAVSGGVVAMAGGAWVVALLAALAFVLHGRGAHAAHAWVSLVLGIGAPLFVLWLIEPAVAQLQGGLTPYGDVVIWPWIGMAFVNSAQSQVTSLPSIAVAVLMVVLAALIYMVVRLRGEHPPAEAELSPHGTSDMRWLWELLREEVPWLAGRSKARGGERPIDAE